MDSEQHGDELDIANNLADDADGLPLTEHHDVVGQEDQLFQGQVDGEGEEDAPGVDIVGQDSNDAPTEDAGLEPPIDQEEVSHGPSDSISDAHPVDGVEYVNQLGDADTALQHELNELKIELLSSRRDLDVAHERELGLQKQLDELTKQRSLEARASAEKISRLENRVADLQHQLEEAARHQQPSPSSDIRIRAAEVQELKARIKQYEIKLASSEEISSIRKEAEMERIRTDASWQHRMLSDQVLLKWMLMLLASIASFFLNRFLDSRQA
jgi:archaellum component FlaC